MAATSEPRPRLTTRIPLLLWVVALATVMIGAIVGLAEFDNAASIAFAIVAGAAAVTTITIVVRDELAEDDPQAATRAAGVRRLAAALGVIAVASLAVAILGGSSDADSSSTARATPAGAVDTVRDFIFAAAVNGDGGAACGYLTTAEQASLGATAGLGCRDVLTNGIAAPDEATSDRAVRALRSAVGVHGGRATVRLGTGRGAMTFVLERVTPAEEDQFDPPASAWRIASGATAVLHERGAAR